MHYTAALPWGSGPLNSCGILAAPPGGSGQQDALSGGAHTMGAALWVIRDCYPSRMPCLLWAPGWWPGGLIPYPYSRMVGTCTGVSNGRAPAWDRRWYHHSHTGGGGGHPIFQLLFLGRSQHSLLFVPPQPHWGGGGVVSAGCGKGDAASDCHVSGPHHRFRGVLGSLSHPLEGSARHRAPPTRLGGFRPA